FNLLALTTFPTRRSSDLFSNFKIIVFQKRSFAPSYSLLWAIMEVFRDVAGIRQYITKHRTNLNSLGLVPTMGALHQGHINLVRRSEEHTSELQSREKLVC